MGQWDSWSMTPVLAISKWLGRLTLSICPKRGGFTAGFLHLLKAVPNVKQVGPQLYMSQRYGPRSVGMPKFVRNGCIQTFIGSKDTHYFVFFLTNSKFDSMFQFSMHSAEQASFLGCDFWCQNQAPWEALIEAFIWLVWNPTNSPACRSLNLQLPPRDGTLQ